MRSCHKALYSNNDSIALNLSSMNFLDLFFAPIAPFVGHPARIAVIATVFWVMLFTLRTVRQYWAWSLLWTAVIWSAFAIWEWSVLLQGANIRVDLFLIYPPLLGFTIWGLWAGWRSPRKSR